MHALARSRACCNIKAAVTSGSMVAAISCKPQTHAEHKPPMHAPPLPLSCLLFLPLSAYVCLSLSFYFYLVFSVFPCLSSCRYVYLPRSVFVSTYLHVSHYVSLHLCISFCVFVLSSCPPLYILLRPCMHESMQACMHACRRMHTHTHVFYFFRSFTAEWNCANYLY